MNNKEFKIDTKDKEKIKNLKITKKQIQEIKKFREFDFPYSFIAQQLNINIEIIINICNIKERV